MPIRASFLGVAGLALVAAACFGCGQQDMSQPAAIVPTTPTTSVVVVTPVAPATPVTLPPPVASCVVTLSINQASFDRTGGNAVLTISASAAACAWQLTIPTWVQTGFSLSGTGSATLDLHVPASTTPHTGTISISGSSVSIAQAVDPALAIQSASCGNAAAGTYDALACSVVIWEGTSPFSTNIQAFADLSGFGLSNKDALSQCPACGQTEFDMDLHVPAGMAPGIVPITFLVTDAQGRTATAVANFQVLAGVPSRR